MNKKFDINVSRSEALRRYVLGAGLIGAVLASASVPAWVALLACYPIFTAMIQWDPFNALMQKAVAKTGKDVQEAMFRNSAVR
jgi:hypothetical protein